MVANISGFFSPSFPISVKHSNIVNAFPNTVSMYFKKNW